LWVIWYAAGLGAHTSSFDSPPASPPLGKVSVVVEVADVSSRYLARRASLDLPRDPAPARADQPDSLFQPIAVRLYPASTVPVSPGWAVIRASVRRAPSGRPAAGALVRVLRVSDQAVLARGMSDERGEALVAVPGIPLTTFSTGEGPPLATEVDVTVQAIFDPAAAGAPDPDALEKRAGLPATSSSHKLAAGRELVASLSIQVS
jgi:hypothetical protein